MLSEVAFSFCLLAVLVVVVVFYLKAGTMSLMAASSFFSFRILQQPDLAQGEDKLGEVVVSTIWQGMRDSHRG